MRFSSLAVNEQLAPDSGDDQRHSEPPGHTKSDKGAKEKDDSYEHTPGAKCDIQQIGIVHRSARRRINYRQEDRSDDQVQDAERQERGRVAAHASPGEKGAERQQRQHYGDTKVDKGY